MNAVTYDEDPKEYYEEQSNAYLSNIDISRNYMQKAIVDYINNRCPSKNIKLLDIGCGNGQDVIAYSKLGIKNIIGIDYSLKMVNLAKEKIINKNIDIQRMNILDINSFAKEEFDIITARYSHFLIDESLDKIYSKIFRILKVGGMFVTTFPNMEIFKNNKYLKDNKEYVNYTLFNEKIAVKKVRVRLIKEHLEALEEYSNEINYTLFYDGNIDLDSRKDIKDGCGITIFKRN